MQTILKSVAIFFFFAAVIASMVRLVLRKKGTLGRQAYRRVDIIVLGLYGLTALFYLFAS